MLTIDPCGDVASFPKAVKVDLERVHIIKVPVLVVAGANDKLFPTPAGPNQTKLFTRTRTRTGTRSRSVRQTTLADTAHAFTVERSHNQFTAVINKWLHRHIS